MLPDAFSPESGVSEKFKIARQNLLRKCNFGSDPLDISRKRTMLIWLVWT